jgi:hypothetical protein
MLHELRAWKIYGAVSTLALVVLCVSAFTVTRQSATFGTINVQRINVLEPNGVLRMVISNRARFPGVIVKGKQYPFDRRTAGILFYNDEGTENGGLIFGGHEHADGTVSSYGHLSFDRYDQDQAFSVGAVQDRTGESTRIAFIDPAHWPITDLLRLPRRKWREFLATHPRGAPRLMMERAVDGSVSLVIKDRRGRTRILIKVGRHGTPVIRLFDAGGRVIAQLPSKRESSGGATAH